MRLVTIERGDGVALITLNRPEAMNALSRALQRDVADAFVEVGEDASVRAVVLTGAGDRAFSAGLDLKEVAADGLGGPPGASGKGMVEALIGCGKPVIGAVNGVAITGGFELALNCDILIASTNARFADTHVRVGVIPGWGLSQMLSRTIGLRRAKELSLTGNFIDAQTALAWGLVNRVVEPAALLPAAHALAADIATCDPDMVRRYRALIDDGFGLAFEQAMDLERVRSRADNAKVTAELVAERRAGIQARGRVQQG